MKTSPGQLRGAAIVLLLASGLIASCTVPTQAHRLGRAQIEESHVQILESFPVQVEVLIKGNLPDSCTKIDEIVQRFDEEERIFWIEARTVRNPEDVCAQALVPFEEVVSLDVYGLPAGTYTVDVHGVRASFTLSVDNSLSDLELSNPASAYRQEQGYALEIRTDEQGNQVGFCLFPNGSECEEWAYYRGECVPPD